MTLCSHLRLHAHRLQPDVWYATPASLLVARIADTTTASFTELKDAIGEPLFETIQISLVCDDCLKTDHPELYAAPLNPVKHRASLTMLFHCSQVHAQAGGDATLVIVGENVRAS